MLKIKKRNLFWEYFFILGIIALTGFEFFFRDIYILYFIFGPLSLYVFFKRKLKFTKRFIYFLLALVILTFSQSLVYHIPFSVVFTTFLRFMIYFLIGSIVIKNFTKVYINLLLIISSISLFFYLIINISPTLYSFLLSLSSGIKPLSFNSEAEMLSSNPNNTLIFFTIPHEYIYRNSGPFWEPGMFGVFLSIGFAMVIFKYGIKNYRSLLLILTGISTLSTTTFIAFFLIIGVHLYLKKANTYTILGFITLSIIVIQVFNLPFINDKINSDINNSDKAYSRFGAMIVHYNQILDSPWIGYGTYIDKDQEIRLGELEVTPNGISNVIRFFGVPFSLIYYFLLYKGARMLSNSIVSKRRGYATLLYSVLLVVAFSQDVTTRHFYFILITIPLLYNYSKDKNGIFVYNGKKHNIRLVNKH